MDIDQIEFDDEDPLNRLDRETVRADHVFPQAEIKVESEVLDFSFMKIEDIESIKRKEPWAGRRRPIPEENPEEDEKKNDQVVEEEKNK